ncbi:MAG: EthD domain-containing protein, partial [Caldimonas sp.]
ANGLSRTAAQRHWRGEHARLFSQLPGLLSYVQNHAVLDGNDDPVLDDPGFDIFAEVEFSSARELDAVADSAQYREQILSDEKRLLDASRRTFLMTRRVHLSGTPPPNAFKLALFLSCPRVAVDRREGEGWSNDPRLRDPLAQCSMGYLVDSVGGPVPRAIDLVVQWYYRSLADSLQAYRKAEADWGNATSDGLRLEAATIVSEIEILPRWPSGAPERSLA